MSSGRCSAWMILVVLFAGCGRPAGEKGAAREAEKPVVESVEDSLATSEEDSVSEGVQDTLTLSEMAMEWMTSRKDSLRMLLCRSRGFCRISPYDRVVKKHARRWGFDWRLISAQIFVESRFREQAKSKVGAMGLMQIMPSTAKWLGKDPASMVRPEDNIALGCYYNRKLYELWKDREESHRLAFTFASYNAGPGRVRRATRRAEDPYTWDGIRPHLPGQTRAYVVHIFRKYEEYKMIIP